MKKLIHNTKWRITSANGDWGKVPEIGNLTDFECPDGQAIKGFKLRVAKDIWTGDILYQ